jgi:membrane-associated phospholipid phosphatase
MNEVTGFGDSAVLLPLAVLLLFWLPVARSAGAALWWLIAFVLTTGATTLLKIYFLACPPVADLHSPSGHTSFSVLVYGAITAIIAVERTVLWQRIATCLVGVGVIAGIAVSRLLLHLHTLLEVEIGLAIGSAGLVIFATGYAHSPRRHGGLATLVIAILGAVALLHGRELGVEHLLHRLGGQLHASGLACS